MEAGFIADSLGNVVCLGFEPGAKERFENWETNIRRIAAAVNACEGIETEWLETGVNLKSQISDAIKERNKAYNAVMAEIAEKEYLQAQNERLLAALREIQSDIPQKPKLALTAIIKEKIDAVLKMSETKED